MLQKVIDSWSYDREYWYIGGLVLLVVALLWLMVHLLIKEAEEEAEEWAEFSSLHNCQKVGHMKGDAQTGVGYGMAANGQFGTIITTTSTPDKTAWECDDGVTYWR